MTTTNDGTPDPVTDVVRPADLRARAQQSSIPTQGGPPLLPPPRSGPPPMGPMVGPPSGPARRSPLLTSQGRPTPQHPSGEHPPVDDEVSVPLKVRLAGQWRRAREVAKTPSGRWTLIGVAAVLQVFLLFSTVMWWVGTPSAIAPSRVAPMTWTGIVYDVGAAGVNLRSTTAIDPANAKDTAARGSRLAVSCGQTGDEVQKGNVHTATWLKTTDGLFVSMLYIRVPDRQSIPSCADSTVDAPLLALSDPANPNLPPPPGTRVEGTNATDGSRNGARPAGQVGQPLAVGTDGVNGAAVPQPPAAPANGPVATNDTATAHSQSQVDTTDGSNGGAESSAPSTDPVAAAPGSSGSRHAAHAATSNPDTSPVG